MGSPAKVVRELDENEIEHIVSNAKDYAKMAQIYLNKYKGDF